MSTQLRFTVHDLELLPFEDGKRYEIIDGELFVSTATHWRHQLCGSHLSYALQLWDRESERGIIIPAPGVIFAEDEAVIPDLVWISRERFARIVGDDGHALRPLLSPPATRAAGSAGFASVAGFA